MTIRSGHMLCLIAGTMFDNVFNARFHSSVIKVNRERESHVCSLDSRVIENFMIPCDTAVDKGCDKSYFTIVGNNRFILHATFFISRFGKEKL